MPKMNSKVMLKTTTYLFLNACKIVRILVFFEKLENEVCEEPNNLRNSYITVNLEFGIRN
jgi:hypothetical protein